MRFDVGIVQILLHRRRTVGVLVPQQLGITRVAVLQPQMIAV